MASEDSKTRTEREETAVTTLVHVVFPFGTAIWAFSQAPGGPAWATWLLVALTALSLFYGVNQTLKIADERLNPRAQEVIN